MSLCRVHLSTPLLCTLLLGACVGRMGEGTLLGDDGDGTAEDTGGDEDLGEGDPEGDDGDDEVGEGEEPLPAEFCVDACAEPYEGGCLTPEACVDYCEAEVGAWTVEIGEAFAACASTNPVCYESMENCIFNELHPPGTAFDLRLEGEDLQDHEGATVFVWHDPQLNPSFAAEVSIEDGAFALAWSEPVSVFGPTGPLMLLFIDVDGDGGCDPSVDRTAAEYLEWNGDYEAPAFALTLRAPIGPADFVCDFLP